MDGVKSLNLDEANQEVANIEEIFERYGFESSWSHTLVNSKSNSATLICQMPGEGNREHYHPDWDEWWFILKGQWMWTINNEEKVINKNDFVFIERNKVHQITAIGDTPSIRLAVSRYDVDHVYTESAYK
jgi:quercetin dioxygenase-like cupin family protein